MKLCKRSTILMKNKTSLFQKLQANWKSGITVSLVSSPLSVSLAVAAHASPVMGIITAIWAGLVASIFGGSDFNVVGPTGALSGILATYAMVHGQDSLAMLAILSGAIIFLAYILKLQKYLVFIPGSAVHGFTLGVAFIIGLNELNFALGLKGLPGHEKFIDNVIESLRHINTASPVTILTFILFLIALLLFKKYLPKIPGAVAMAPVGIILGILTSAHKLPFNLLTLDSLYPNMQGTFFIMPKLFFNQSLLIPAFAVALVAILETMISAKIADGMTDTKHSKRKEMRGLAFANIASGLMGGIPATAALARTSLNIKTGANNKISATISSICVAIISLFLLKYFKFIPLAAIAAILVFVAIQMVEAEHFFRMFQYDKKNFYLSLITAFVTIYEDPIVGIVFGVGLASVLLVEKLSRGQFDLVINDKHNNIVERVSGDKLEKLVEGSDTVVYSIKGLLCYVNSEAHLNRFRSHLNGSKNIVLRLRSVYYIDIDGVEVIDEIIRLVESQGKNIFISGVNTIIADMLMDNSSYQQLKSKNRVFTKTAEALKHLGFNI